MSDWSETNSRKLDRILLLIEGDGVNTPGLSGRVKTLEKTLYGDDETAGISTKVTVMWRAHVWLLCTLSGAAALLGRELIKYIWKV